MELAKTFPYRWHWLIHINRVWNKLATFVLQIMKPTLRKHGYITILDHPLFDITRIHPQAIPTMKLITLLVTIIKEIKSSILYPIFNLDNLSPNTTSIYQSHTSIIYQIQCPLNLLTNSIVWLIFTRSKYLYKSLSTELQ